MKHEGSQLGIAVAVLVVVALHGIVAKDLRQVSEPKIPASCVSLKGNGRDETSTIQKALNSCAKGRTVHLESGTFISGPLTIPSGVSLWIDSEAVLKASNNPKVFDTGKNICGTLSSLNGGCHPLIYMKHATGSGIYGKGTIDGQGGVKMTGQSITWWDLAKNNNQKCPRLIEIEDSTDITLYQITLKNAPNFHVVAKSTSGFTAWGVTINTPGNASNTDGIDPIDAQNVTITHCSISTGDDNVAIKSEHQPVQHVSITNNVFGTGHGMSIGGGTEAGVSDITVTSLIMRGTTNGLRIKSDVSHGGLVTGVTYTNVCIKNVAHPIILTTHYSKTAQGNNIPEFRDITFNNIDVMTPGKFTFDGYSDAKPVVATLNNVQIAKGSSWETSHAKISGKYTIGASGNC